MMSSQLPKRSRKTEKSDDSGAVVSAAHLDVGNRGITARLPKTAAAFDRLFSLPVNHWADALEAKYDKNTQEHLDAVSRKRKSENKPEPNFEELSIDAAESLQSAVSEIADIDARKEPELAALWRALIDSALDDERSNKLLIDNIKLIPRGVLLGFLRQYRARFSGFMLFYFPKHDLEIFREWGLVRRFKFSTVDYTIFGSFVFFIVLGSILSPTKKAAMRDIFAVRDGLWLNIMAVFGGFYMIVFLASLSVRIFDSSTPTNLGRAIMQLSNKYKP